MRPRQSSVRSSFSREMALEPCSRKRCDREGGLERGFSASAPGNCFHPGMVCSVGDPTKSKMISSWCASLSPARMGLPTSISPKTQLQWVSKSCILSVTASKSYPTPHISIAVVYFFRCNKSSGGRYHRVTTRLVYSLRPSPPPFPRSGTGPS